MDTEGLSLICAGLGIAIEDDEDKRVGYSKGEHCLDNLKDLLRFLRRDDPQTRDVFKQVCKWSIVSKDLIPIIEYYHEDRNLLLNAVKILVFLTMPIEPGSTDIPQQLDYLWGLKSAVTNSDIAAVIVSFLERPLENLERDAFTEDDWKLVQLVLTFFRNILAVQEIPLHQKPGGFASQFLSVRDRFLELLFRENVMDIILVISQYVGGSNAYLRQDNLLLLEIFHYIFMGQDPELIVRAHLNGTKASPLSDKEEIVGIDEHIAQIQSLLQLESAAVRIIGICGIGGTGKTTLARALHNKLATQFSSKSCVLNAQQEIERVGIDCLRKKYLSELLLEDIPSNGFHFAIERVKRAKVLLILDDVENSSQVQDLIGGHGNFGQGSRIIVTSRDMQVLKNAEADEIYQVEVNKASINSLKSIIEEEKKKRTTCRVGNISRHSQFRGTFARVTTDGSKAIIKGNPNSSRNVLLKSQNVTRGPAKKIAWDHPRLPSTNNKILELLHGFLNQFLSGGYNVLMRCIREDIEKEHPAIQKSDVDVFFQVAEFVTSFQFYKYSASKNKEGGDTFETFGDKDADTSDFSGQICGPIAASLNESMFQLVISKWRHAYDGLKETNDYKFLSAAGSLLKNMIRMLDLVLKLLPEDSKEPQTARILLYKLFYDQTEEGMTQFLLNLMKTFDTHKQCKSDLADLVEIIHKVVKLMDNLQSRGTLRVSRKSRKVKKKKSSEGIESGNKQTGDNSCIENEGGISIGNQLPENQSLQKENLPNANFTGEECVILNDNEHENIVEDGDSQVGLEPVQNKNPEHCIEDMLDDTGDFSEEEQFNAISEVDFKVSTLVSALANHNIIQKLCWLLKFYKSNSLAINHYIISMLQRISDDLELQPMLYQLSLLTIFHDILVEQKSCPCKEYTKIVDFLTSLVKKMLKQMKKQPLLFVEVLFWKSRRECHYINAEYLLDELGHLKKKNINWNDTQGDGEIGSSTANVWTRRSIADALGDDEADVVISHDSGYQNHGENNDVIEGLASTSGQDDNNGEQLTEDGSLIAPRRKKKLILNAELEREIKKLYEKFKDERNCTRCIAEALDPDGKISPAQISNTLKKIGLTIKPRRKMGDADKPFSTSPNLLEGGDGIAGIDDHKSVNLEGSLLVQHLQKRKRVRAFNEDQEAMIKVLYEQFKDHRRCSYMIANALDEDGKFTPAQVSRKLKQLGLSVPKKSLRGKMNPNSEDLMELSKDRINESDDETLISLIGRKKVNSKVSSEELHERTSEDRLSQDVSDDEILSSVLKKKMKSRVSSEQLQEHVNEDKLTRDDSDNEMLSSALKTKRSVLKSKHDELETIQIQDRIMDSDSFDDDMKEVSESEKRVGFLNSQQVEHQEVDQDLVDSEDEVAASAVPDNAVSRRKLRMVIDAEDDD